MAVRFEFFPLARVVEETRLTRDGYNSVAELPEEPRYQATWLGTFMQSDGSHLVCDCGDPVVGRFRCFDSETGLDSSVVAPSLSVVLDWWLEAFDAGEVVLEDGRLWSSDALSHRLESDPRRRFLGW